MISDNRIIRTFNGLEKCDTNFNTPEKNCLLGYNCESNECKSCYFTCELCTNYNSKNYCFGCGTITAPDKSIKKTTCEINNIDITNFKDIEVKVPLYKQNEFHERSTLGLWIFISDLSKAKNGNYNIYHVILKDRYVLSIIPNELSVEIFCHTYEDLYRKITSETTLQSNYIDRESDYVLSRVIPSDDQLRYHIRWNIDQINIFQKIVWCLYSAE